MQQLSRKQLRTFCELFGRMRPMVEFENKLGLSPGEVEAISSQLGFDSPEDAMRYFRNLPDDDFESERAQAKKEHAAAEGRLDAQKITALETKFNIIPSKAGTPQEQSKRLAELEKSKTKTDWHLPETTEPEMFAHELTVYGIGFVLNKYGISVQDAVSEVNRLGLRVNFDIVPR